MMRTGYASKSMRTDPAKPRAYWVLERGTHSVRMPCRYASRFAYMPNVYGLPVACTHRSLRDGFMRPLTLRLNLIGWPPLQFLMHAKVLERCLGHRRMGSNKNLRRLEFSRKLEF